MSKHKLSLKDIQRLPKSDIHVHLDGSLRIETILELAEKDKVRLPAHTPEKLRPIVQVGSDCKNLVEYLKAFDVTLAVMQTYESLVRVAFELAEDSANENIRYMEVRYSPILHLRKGMHLTGVVSAVLEGLELAERKYGIKTGVIICGIRHISPEEANRLAALTVAYKNHGVVGFDLAGAEESFPDKKYKDAFERVSSNNINCTLHAGETYGPKSVHQAIHICGAHRIGHGVRLIEDGELVNYVNDHRIPLEMCISSNLQSKVVKRIEDHPIRLFYDLGMRVTVNTDNRLITNTTLSDEYWRLHQELDFSIEEIKEIIINGFKSAFIPYAQKCHLVSGIVAELKSLEHGSAETKKEH
ncbi:MAG: adenosine deaminase [Holophagaceae bacterium]|nr:adenosine deaminase [Holophagaceae bacterium]